MCSRAQVYTNEKEIYALFKVSHFRETPGSEYVLIFPFWYFTGCFAEPGSVDK